MTFSKRFFDLSVCILASLAWVPVILVICLVAVIVQGKPIFYSSIRRVYRDQSVRVFKFRAMVNNADKLANRDTIPVADQRFLNLDLDNPLYTPLGRFLEKTQLVEIPQFLLVLTGDMSLVGNRPLPENVITVLKEVYPDVEHRFDSHAGVAGPIQLIGRTKIADRERIDIEIAYCKFCMERYSPVVDFIILLHTVLITLSLRRPYTTDEVKALLDVKR